MVAFQLLPLWWQAVVGPAGASAVLFEVRLMVAPQLSSVEGMLVGGQACVSAVSLGAG